MSVPLWSRSSRPEELRTEVVVVGAGIAGIGAALDLHRRGVDTIVVDRGAVGSGASSRNAGFLMRGAADNYAAGVRVYGRELARSLWRMTEDNLAGLIELGAERVPSFARRPSCLLAMTEQEACELHRSVEMLRDDGFAADLVWKHADAPWRNPMVRCGLVNPGDGVVNPVELVRHLAAKLPRPVIEHTEIGEIDRGGAEIVVRCAGVRITAPRALVCLNGFVGRLLPEIGAWAMPNRGQMLAVRAPVGAAAVSMAYYANHGYDYFRRVDDETVIFGGRRNRFEPHERTDSDAPSDEVQRSLESLAEEMLGGEFPVVARWAGTMGFSPTGLPIIAPVPGTNGAPDPRVVFCGGFTGHGMSLGVMAARAAVGLVVDGEVPVFPVPTAIPGGAGR
jgi:glycine/D-amino acid oxidase-like deaminating enzyme